MSTAKAWPLSVTLSPRSNAATFRLRPRVGGSAFASARNGKSFRYPGRRPSYRGDAKRGCVQVENRRLKWTGQRRARSAGCPTLNFHHAVNHHGQPEEETPPEDEQAQAPEALEVAPSPEAYLAEVRHARLVRAALPSPGFFPTRRFPRRVFSSFGGTSAKGADCGVIEKR